EAVAVSNRRGEAELFVEPGFEALASVEANHRPPAAVHGGELLRVPTVRLDDYDKRRVGFIKIDVEGHEVAAVEGGLELIARDRPTILVEAEER
ncbi:FkbM family methyltransferase, partial [Klebsiella pneumoniae]